MGQIVPGRLLRDYVIIEQNTNKMGQTFQPKKGQISRLVRDHVINKFCPRFQNY